MAPRRPWTVNVQDHPGSSIEDIENEPDWGAGHQHRVGYRNKGFRVPGWTGDEEYHAEFEYAQYERSELEDEEAHGKLVNFRDLIEHQPDFHLRHPENKSLGWRYVLDATEDWVKTDQEWPLNVKRRKQQEEKEGEEKQKNNEAKEKKDQKKDKEGGEHDWRRQSDDKKHNDAYATGDQKHDKNEPQQQDDDTMQQDDDSSSQDGQEKSEQQSLEDKYTPQEIALLRSLQHEKDYLYTLGENDGTDKSPQTQNRTQISIDEQDQFSPDNWVPRSSHLTRLTGKHPLNAEPDLSDLFNAGLITPNELHYVRNHGAVPRLLWEFYKLDVEYNGEVQTYSMEELTQFKPINIAVALACDGNRRKELNMIKRSKGFNWGSGAISCAYWKGPLLRDVLLASNVPEALPRQGRRKYWVNFEGSDELCDGVYGTCIPFEYAMTLQNDVMLAYEMNNVPLPPDHGYPLRLIIPGYIGGRCVKWLRKIWISDKENDSHYHIWDNRVLPDFVTEMDGPFADTLFHHPDTACNEQNLNSIITKPAQGESLPLTEARGDKTYRIAGIAYDGGGHEVQRVEVSLDDGETWLYCIRSFPKNPIRHGNRFWTWVHWHVDVKIQHLLRVKSISVRCYNVFKNTQPKRPSWNIMGMMNNCWYVVRPEISQSEDSDVPRLLFRHPTEPGKGEGGWMKPSAENKIMETKQAAGAPQKRFTRAEIEKHNSKEDCWIVVDGKVYDATSVLDWHPGGAAAILAHAGAVHLETTDEFDSIHDDYAFEKLNECALGVITDKAAEYIKKNAEATAKEKASSSKGDEVVALQKHRWIPVKLANRKEVSKDSRTYTFQLPDNQPLLGLGTCQHILLGFHMKDRMLVRSYTPTRPLLPPPEGKIKNQDSKPFEDGNGTFDLTIKTYFPDDNQPGGAMSNILDCIPIGEEVEVRGPTGDIVYNSQGKFNIEGNDKTFKRISLVLGGSGITPGYALIARIMMTKADKTEIRVIDANKTENDILMRGELDEFQKKSDKQLQVTHVLSHPGDDWDGLKGHVDEDKIKNSLFPPAKDSVALLCGPPTMIQKAALPALKDWGYVEDENLFGF